MSVTRRDVLKTLAFAAGASALGCEPGGERIPAGPVGCTTARAISISENHGHTVQVTEADLNAAAEKVLDIAGTAGHSHEITLTSEQLALIADGYSVEVTSTLGVDHQHTVVVGCHGTGEGDPGGGGGYYP